MRTCVGCRNEDESDAMIRLVFGPDGELGVDLAGHAFGRGAWVHPRPACLERAAQGGVDRSFKSRVGMQKEELFRRVRDAADRRVAALVSAAQRSGAAAPGSDAAQAAFDAGRAVLLVLAEDARAAAESGFVARVASAGRVVIWGTKEVLGRATGRSDTAVVAISERRLADAIRRTAALSFIPAPEPRRGRTEAVVEVR